MIAKALLAAAALLAITHPALALLAFGALGFAASHAVALAAAAELAAVAFLCWRIAETLARGRAPRRPALA